MKPSCENSSSFFKALDGREIDNNYQDKTFHNLTVNINKKDKYFTKFISQLKICQMLVHTKLARH